MKNGTEVKQYRITRQLGHGGMGDVYQARDLELDRDVAVKCMKPDLMQYEEITARFRTEARTLASVRHPNIATVHRFFEHDGALFLVMEFIPGTPFDEMIQKGAPPIDQTITMIQQALSGLGYAHDHKVVHRDIKPANLMLDTHGTVKVLDFGIAHIVGESTLTGTGMMLGTPGYMAPEQVLGQKVDRRTDLYAMGIVLYQMLTGKLPFVGNSQFEAQQAHFQERPKQLELLSGKVPPALHDAVLHAIAKESDDRFQSASEFSSALGQTLSGISSPGLPKQHTDAGTEIRNTGTGTVLTGGAGDPKPGNKGKLIAAGAAAALAIGAGAAFLLKPAPEPVEPRSPIITGTPTDKSLVTEPETSSASSTASLLNPVLPKTEPDQTAESNSPPNQSEAAAVTGTSGAPENKSGSKAGKGNGGAPPPKAETAGNNLTNGDTANVTPDPVVQPPATTIQPVNQPEPEVPSGPPTVAVVDFTASSPTSYKASLAELVVDEIVNRSKFDVLEREKLAALTGELSFQNESGFVSPTSAVQMGNMLGAQLLVTGHVIDHGSSKQNYSGYGITTTKITNRLKARLEVIDLSTGSKLFSRIAQASKETQVVQGARSDSGQRDLGAKVAKQLVTAMLAAPRLKEMLEGPKLVSIAVNSSPAEADVEVDGTYYGTAGSAIELLPGTHQIRVSLPGYTAWEKRVLVKEGTKLMARLQKVNVTRTESTINLNTN